MDPLGRICPTCNALVGEQCRSGFPPVYMADVHAYRLPAMDGKIPTVQEFDDAVENSELI